MMAKCLFFLSILILTLMPTHPCLSQTRIDIEKLPTLEPVPWRPIGYRVIFFNEKSKLPKQLSIKGVVTNYTLSLGCGVITSSGTLEIKLLKRLKHYPHKYIYVIAPCLSDSSNLLGRTIALDVYAAYDTPSIYTVFSNRINSHGIPFYALKEWLD